MARLDYVTGYGSRVHILQGDGSRDTLCGKPAHHEWSEADDPVPSDICKNCMRTAQDQGLLTYEICSQCSGTGKIVQPTV